MVFFTLRMNFSHTYTKVRSDVVLSPYGTFMYHRSLYVNFYMLSAFSFVLWSDFKWELVLVSILLTIYFHYFSLKYSRMRTFHFAFRLSMSWNQTNFFTFSIKCFWTLISMPTRMRFREFWWNKKTKKRQFSSCRFLN